MRLVRSILFCGALVATGLGSAWFAGLTPLNAADHFDPPARVDPAATGAGAAADIAADLADNYLFADANFVYTSVDFGGPSATTLPAFYDRDVLYTISLSNAGSRTDAEFNIEIRFGQDTTKPNAYGVRISGIPGTTAPIMGPVESILTDPSGVRVFAGLIDDPFNFDAVGLRDTRNSGTLMFMNTRNRFAGLNTTTVIIAIPKALIQNGTNPITSWTTSARIIKA